MSLLARLAEADRQKHVAINDTFAGRLAAEVERVPQKEREAWARGYAAALRAMRRLGVLP